MSFLLPSQQCQGTELVNNAIKIKAHRSGNILYAQ